MHSRPAFSLRIRLTSWATLLAFLPSALAWWHFIPEAMAVEGEDATPPAAASEAPAETAAEPSGPLRPDLPSPFQLAQASSDPATVDPSLWGVPSNAEAAALLAEARDYESQNNPVQAARHYFRAADGYPGSAEGMQAVKDLTEYSQTLGNAGYPEEVILLFESVMPRWNECASPTGKYV